MTLLSIRYFLTMAEKLHYTQASQELHISQPSLSVAIAKLEEELGVPLFLKQGNKIQLSEYGELLVPYLRKSLLSIDEGLAQLSAKLNASLSNINLGFIFSISHALLPKLIEKFYEDPDNATIKFNFHQNLNNNLIEMLREGKADFAFCVDAPDDLKSMKIYDQPLYVAVSTKHSLADRKSIRLEELRDEKFIMLDYSSSLRDSIQKALGSIGIKPNIILEANQCNAVVTYVAMDYGISIIPMIPNLNPDDVVYIPIEGLLNHRPILVVWVPDRYENPQIKRVRKFLENTFGS